MLLACCAIGWLSISAAAGIVAVEGALHPQRLPVTYTDEALAESVVARDRATVTDASIAAEDGVILRAWIIVPSKANRDAVILLHGQGDNRAGMLGNADLLLRRGYAVLLPDARAHGESGGAIAAYGVKEADDLRRWFEWLQQTRSPHCVDGLGDSMGAAILLQALAVEQRFCAVIAESPFSSFREASYDRLGQFFGTGPWLGRTLLRPSLVAGLLNTRWKYHVDLERASPEYAVAHSRVPVLLIHGLADTNLPPRHSERIKAANANVVLWEPLNAGHCGASAAAPAEYERRVVNWFSANSLQDERVSTIAQASSATR